MSTPETSELPSPLRTTWYGDTESSLVKMVPHVLPRGTRLPRSQRGRPRHPPQTTKSSQTGLSGTLTRTVHPFLQLFLLEHRSLKPTLLH